MENLKLSDERQTQIKNLWEKYKSEAKEDDKKSNTNEIVSLITQWNQYKEKIKNDTLTLDEYTNRLGGPTATMPGGYLCNFLERTTRTVLGSSKPGNALNFEVKLNDDNTTYHIKSQAQTNNATREEAEIYFNNNIKGLLKDIVSEVSKVIKKCVLNVFDNRYKKEIEKEKEERYHKRLATMQENKKLKLIMSTYVECLAELGLCLFSKLFCFF